MVDAQYPVLIVDSHPTQYAPPLYRRMAQRPGTEILVAYCSLQGAERGVDAEFGVEVAWDVPLLEGYPWVYVPNKSPRPALGRFFGLVNPGLWKLVRNGRYDAVVTYTGYAYLSFWILAAAAKLRGIPFLASTDAYTLGGMNPGRWKSLLKRLCLPLIYRLLDVVVVPSQATARFVESLGVASDRIAYTPGGFDSEWWAEEADKADRRMTRARWGIPDSAPVLLFCAKLQPWKRPEDAVRAFAKLGNPDAFLIIAGDGPLRSELEDRAKNLGVSNRIVFLGFVNQTQMPELYRCADLLLLTSGYDGCPLVVCEAMACGCPVVLSDAIPGRFELVRRGVTGFVYPCGDVEALTLTLRQALGNPEELKKLSASAVKQMAAWSLPTYVEGLLRAVDQGMRLRGDPLKARRV